MRSRSWSVCRAAGDGGVALAAAPAAAQHTRVTAALGGVPPDGVNGAGVLSADGRFVAFESDASNLVAHRRHQRLDRRLRA